MRDAHVFAWRPECFAGQCWVRQADQNWAKLLQKITTSDEFGTDATSFKDELQNLKAMGQMNGLMTFFFRHPNSPADAIVDLEPLVIKASVNLFKDENKNAF